MMTGEVDDAGTNVIFGRSASDVRWAARVINWCMSVITLGITEGVGSGFSVIHGSSGNRVLRSVHAQRCVYVV